MNTKLKLLISLIVPQLAGALGVLFTPSMNNGWYTQLQKPPLNPPSWIFGPVWTLLYLLMGIALYLVWKEGTAQKAVRTALWIFAVQLVLNASWSLVFFGAQAPGWSLVIIVAMLIAIASTIWAFARVSKVAAWLLVPYIVWVSFATYLNAAIYIINY